MKISIGSDHAGFVLKSKLIEYLKGINHEIFDKGPNNEERVDYPDYAHKLVQSILSNETELGVLICGSGIGISIALNRFSWVRAALVSQPEMAGLARQHNDANVLILGARTLGIEIARDCLGAFLDTEFEGGRHQRRVDKMSG